MKIFIFPIFLFLILIQSCSDSVNSTDTHSNYAVNLTGKVLSKDGTPIPAAIAQLVKQNLFDTTDSKGEYSFKVQNKEGTILTAAVNSNGKDTIKLIRDGQIITMIEISKYIDTIPDVFIVQRNIGGKVLPNNLDLLTITGKIWNDSDADEPIHNIPFYYSTQTLNYSGFVYFVYTGTLENYSVCTYAFNKENLLTGQSDTIHFSSLAGDIEIPEFDPKNLSDTIIFSDTIAEGDWKPGKTYLLKRTVKIPSGKVLTINKGSTIIIDSLIDNNGKIITIGDSSEPVTIIKSTPFKSMNWAISGGRIDLNYTFFQNCPILPYGDTIMLRNCVFGNNSSVQFYGKGFWLIDKCIFYNSTSDPAVVVWPALNANPIHISNSIFLNNVCGIFSYTFFYEPVLELNNLCFFNSLKANFIKGKKPRNLDSNTTYQPDIISPIFSDPLLKNIDLGKEDFHLNAGSPCIGTGTNGQNLGIY